MKLIHVLFTRPKLWNPLSWSIMKVLNTDYSHVVLLIDDKVYQSSSHGVEAIKEDKFLKKVNVSAYVGIDVNDMELGEIAAKIRTFRGRRYGALTLIGAVLFMLFGVKWLNDGKKTFTCSEFVAEVLDCILPEWNKPTDFVTPEDILNALEER